MSDPREAPDPVDKAYLEAQALLADEAERAARRARVLAAVERDGAGAAAVRRRSWARTGLAVAACAAGLGLFVVTQVNQPPIVPPPPKAAAEATSEPPTTIAPEILRAEATPVEPAPPVQRPEPAAPRARREAEPPPTGLAPPPPPPAMQQTAPPPRAFPGAPAAAPPPVQQRAIEERAAAPAPPVARTPQPPAAAASPGGAGGLGQFANADAVGAASPQAARLHAAAAAGRTAEVEALLAQGVAIDAPDAEGNTALMLSIQARRPAVAAVLRARGASLDRRNNAGRSAREMAAAIGDPELDRALGLTP